MKFRLTETSDWNDRVNQAYVDDIRRAGLKADAEREDLPDSTFYENVYVYLDTAEDFWKLKQAVDSEVIVGAGLDGTDADGVPELEIYNDYRE